MKFKVESVNISEKKGVQKHPVDEIELIENLGIRGDAHAGTWHRQVSFLSAEAVDRFKKKNPEIKISSGDFGENIVTRGVEWADASVGEKIRINGAELEVTQIGKTCHDHCAIYEAAGECIMPTQGIFARVLTGGKICAEDSGDYGF
jgi:MOSC domain-containing protein YiiM